jgi:hypothetical protein
MMNAKGRHRPYRFGMVYWVRNLTRSVTMIAFNRSLPSRQFDPGSVVMTPHALAQLQKPCVLAALHRHMTGDWGDCCSDDAQANDQALIHGSRLFSVYHDESGVKFWIITEADRSSTCILLPEEY